jgi:hypothetical protein
MSLVSHSDDRSAELWLRAAMTSEMPIEAGWQALTAKLPELSKESAAILRFMFFAGALHYRTMVKTLFEIEDDGETLCRTLHNVAAELKRWQRQESIEELFERKESK